MIMSDPVFSVCVRALSFSSTHLSQIEIERNLNEK